MKRLIIVILIVSSAAAQAKVNWYSAIDFSKGVMQENETTEEIKGKDLFRFKVYAEQNQKNHLWDLGLGLAQFKMRIDTKGKESQSFNSSAPFIYLANRYQSDNGWAVGVAIDQYLKQGIITGNNSQEFSFIGFNSTYDPAFLNDRLRLNLSIMNGLIFGSRRMLFLTMGFQFQFN